MCLCVVYVCARVFTCVHVGVGMCVNVYTCVCVPVCGVYVYACVFTCVCVGVCVHVCECVYMCGGVCACVCVVCISAFMVRQTCDPLLFGNLPCVSVSHHPAEIICGLHTMKTGLSSMAAM